MYLGIMQFLTYGICTVSWRAVSQANILASVLADTSFASVQYFVIKRIAKDREDSALIPWFGYTFGGVIGTVVGIYMSLWWFGK